MTNGSDPPRENNINLDKHIKKKKKNDLGLKNDGKQVDSGEASTLGKHEWHRLNYSHVCLLAFVPGLNQYYTK